MKVYFLSCVPCALMINDAYFGLTDGFERFADISLKDNLFIRFIPQNALPVCFFLTEDILSSPPIGCEVYLVKDGVAIYARDFSPRDFALKIIAQKRLENTLVSVYAEGALQVSIQSPKGFFVSTLPPSFCQCELFFQEGLFFLKSPEELAIFTQKGERVFCEKVLSYTVENNELCARIPLSDLFSRYADGKWKLSENGLEKISYTIAQSRTKDGEINEDKITEELLPYAFFESVLIGANYAEILSNELLSGADKIAAYLGDFCAVTLTAEPSICGLVYQKAERLFKVNYFAVTIENKKIVDISPI